jgi:enoyl-CoA hydratase/carnithine racemase
MEAIMSGHVKIEAADGVMTLTLQRPEKKNALSGVMYDALSDAVRQAEVDASVRVVLFQGDGDSFTAGNDLADFARQAGDENSAESPALRFIETISKASKPLVAAVQGNAVGIGTTMLLHCDLVYLADNARLITPFVNLAPVPEAELASTVADRSRALLRYVCARRADGGGRSTCVRPGQCRSAAGRTSQEGT